MITVNVRELKQKARQLIRRICELGEEIQITDRGEVVALLVPAKRADDAWIKLDKLAEEIGAYTKMSESGSDLASDWRR